MITQLKQTPGIYLIGFMGSGKTTVGRALAERLGWRFIDIDGDIEESEKVAISEIFESRGEEEFRRIETGAVRRRVMEIRCGKASVVSVGGGAFVREENRQLMDDHGVTIWLDVPFELATRRIAQAEHRPLARDPQRFAELFETRRPIYSLAQYRIDVTTDDPEQGVQAILGLGLF